MFTHKTSCADICLDANTLYFVKCDALMCVGKFHYGFVHFIQGCFIYGIRPRFSSGKEITA